MARDRFGLAHRHLAPDRAEARVAAYIYGNILTLAAVLTADLAEVADGQAVIIVLVTTGTTYLAHVLANDIAHRMHGIRDERRSILRQELRDAVPIATSGLPSAAVLALAWLGWLPAIPAQLVAAAVAVVRIGAVGAVVARLDRGVRGGLAWIAGLGLAVIGALIAILKVLLLH